ncbi:MAG: SDR family NAD(P)-dependent oxidoreductase [Candidatus Thermoplasmatota archaeon]|nr:SDR family NAD(P)-dependent oxidoreductase [Candidatus Thermoplasmatota archaeon]
MSPPPSEGGVAVVTGASRGIGKGIAHELGLAGWTVYVTGRSRPDAPPIDGTRGTIDATADLVTMAGGKGIAVELDHTDDDRVQALAEQITEAQEGLDLLVNNVWGGYESYDPDAWNLEVWEQPVERWDKMFATGVRAHYTTTQALAPLMLDRPRPLIVGITAGDRGRYVGEVAYDVAKHAQARLCTALHHALGPHGIHAVALQSGFARTERVLDAFEVDETSWEQEPDLAETHSTRYVGRLVLALYNAEDLPDRSGGAHRAGDLGRAYGVTDVDGRAIAPFELPEDL